MSFARLRLAWQAFKTRRKMDRQFRRREDPFAYGSAPYELRRLEAMDEALSDRRWPRALEAGCAEGHFTEKLARRAERVLALDISAVALERARRRAPAARFARADLLDWAPPPGERFDLIVLGDVLYYLDRPGVAAEFEALFPRVAGWLAPGGRLLLAHAFKGERELARRRSFHERFERAGLTLLSAAPVVGAEWGGARCLLAALEAPVRPDARP